MKGCTFLLNVALLVYVCVGENHNEVEFDAALLGKHSDNVDDLLMDMMVMNTSTSKDVVFIPHEQDQLTTGPALVRLLTEDQERGLLANLFPQYGFGECNHVLEKGKETITVFIYLNICPTEPECEVIRAWSTSLTAFLRHNYGMTCIFRYLLNKTCKSSLIRDNLPDVMLLGDNDGDDLEKEFATLLPATTTKLKYAVNFFRIRKSSTQTQLKHVFELEKQWNIQQLMDFYICDQDEACVYDSPGNTEQTKVSKWVDILAYSRMRIVRKFDCPATIGAVPVEFYNSYNKHTCICHCPSTHEKKLVNGQYKCVRKLKKCKCKWIQQCFQYEIGSEMNNKDCVLKDWHKKKALAPIPMAFDNYVGFKTNKHDVSPNTATKAPCIQLQIGDTVVDYSWSFFQKNRHAIFDDIELKKAGTYKIILRAFDYGPIPAVCWTWLTVRDKNRPSSTKTCPESFSGSGFPTNTAIYSKDNYDKAQSLILQFNDWIKYRQNDRCIDDHATDPECLKRNKYERWTFNAQKETLKSFSEPEKCFKIGATDTTWMTSHLNANLLTTSTPGRAQHCKKCCAGQYQFTEWYQAFGCHDIRPKKQCCAGARCSIHQCLQGDGKTFFKAEMGIHSSLKASSEEIIDHFPDNGYNKVDQIHFELNPTCQTYGAGCKIEKNLQELLEETRAYHDSFFDIFTGFNVNQLVKWRYKITGQSGWKDYHDTQTIESFDRLETAITLQAWSACGLVCEYTFYVFVHMHTKLAVCEHFDTYSFYQSSRYHTGVQTRFCNYPESDFAELTFDFNPQAVFEQGASAHHFKHKFKSMTCTAQFGQGTSYTSNSPTVAATTDAHRFLKRYAVVLAEKPTTRADTPLKWTCVFEYKGYKADSPVLKKSCSQDFTFCDCEKPGWDCPWGICRKECTNPAERKPNQVCAGTKIVWDRTADQTIVDDKIYSCCDKCGDPDSTKCESIFPNIYTNTICSCRVKKIDPSIDPNAKYPVLNTQPLPKQVDVPKMELKLFKSTVVSSSTGPSLTASIAVPAPYRMISGGAILDSKCDSFRLTESYPDDPSTWKVSAVTSANCDSTLQAYAIGLFDPDSEWTIQTKSKLSGAGAKVSRTVNLPQGFTMTGGGARVDTPTTYGLTGSSPFHTGDGWTASARTTNSGNTGGKVTTYVIGVQYKGFSPQKCTITLEYSEPEVRSPTQTITADNEKIVIGGGASVSQSHGGEGSFLTSYIPTDETDWKTFAASARGKTVNDLERIRTFGIVCPATVACFPPPTTAIPKMVLQRSEKTSTDEALHSYVDLQLPPGFKVISGGATIESTCLDYHLYRSQPSYTTLPSGHIVTRWYAYASGYIGSGYSSACTGKLTVYAVGLFDPNDEWSVHRAFASTSSSPLTISTTLSSFYMKTGGAYYTYQHIGIIESAPEASNGWKVRGVNLASSSSNYIQAYAIGVRYRGHEGPMTSVAEECSVKSISSSSGIQFPSATFTSDATDVVIGGGGSVAQTSGSKSFLTEIYPGSATTFKASASGKTATDLATVTAYGIVCPNTIVCYPEPTDVEIPKMILQRFEKTSEPISGTNYPYFDLRMPLGYKTVSGGASFESTCTDARFVRSRPSWFYYNSERSMGWTAQVYTPQSSGCTTTLKLYAIGVFDPNDEWAVYIPSRYHSTSSGTASATMTLDPYYMVTGGGFYTANSHSVTKSSPDGSNGWISETVRYSGTGYSNVRSYAIGLR